MVENELRVKPSSEANEAFKGVSKSKGTTKKVRKGNPKKGENTENRRGPDKQG